MKVSGLLLVFAGSALATHSLRIDGFLAVVAFVSGVTLVLFGIFLVSGPWEAD